MAILTIQQLKSKFENGDFPRQQDFWDLIDTLAEDSDSVYFSAVAPEDPSINPLWFNTETEQLAIFYNSNWQGVGGGLDGSSAYSIAVSNGFVGTEQQWLDSLVGPQGSQGPQGNTGPTGPASTIPGPKGDPGDSGIAFATEPLDYDGFTKTIFLNTNQLFDSPTLTGVPIAPTATTGTNSSQIATTAYVSSAISSLVDSSPETLNTLNELAAALADDPNYATTVSTALGNKQNKVSGVSDTEIGYLDGVTSSIQTQLGSKQSIVSGVSDTEIGYLDGVTSAIQTQIDGKQSIVSGISDTEIGYLDGVTSSIQAQIDTKASTGKAIAMAIVFGG